MCKNDKEWREQAFGKLPQVLAVVLGGSRAAATSDVASDYDLYVYTVREVPVDFRRTLLGESAEIDNRFWEPGDEWSESLWQTDKSSMQPLGYLISRGHVLSTSGGLELRQVHNPE
jgi:hypothetical protein